MYNSDSEESQWEVPIFPVLLSPHEAILLMLQFTFNSGKEILGRAELNFVTVVYISSRIAKGAAILVEEYEPLAAEPDQPLGKLKSEKNGDVVTPKRLLDVPDVLEVHVVPLSDEVRMIPELPTTTKVPFA
jgi:hypothetical protein